MTITSAKTGVWILDDTYKKIQSGLWDYQAGLNEPGTLWSFGYNVNGDVGDNTIIPRSSPVQIPGTEWIASGRGLPIALKSNGTLWSWGNNGYGGPIGDNTLIPRSSPVQIPGTQWCALIGSSSGYKRGAFKCDGSLWVWGTNNTGELGQNDTIFRSSPVQIPGTQWISETVDMDRAVIGVKTDGTLWVWGINNNGELGDGTTIPRSSPFQIPGTWSKASTGVGSQSAAIKTDGTLWAMGGTYYGIGAGDGGTPARRSSPVQVPGIWTDLCVQNPVFARKSDGSLWTWGFDRYGSSMRNVSSYTGGQVSSPVQVPGTNWAQVRPGHTHTIAWKTDGTTWVSGRSNHGQLGLNETACISSPVQLPGKWLDSGGTGQATLVRKSV